MLLRPPTSEYVLYTISQFQVADHLQLIDDDHAEEANDLHVNKWAEMVSRSNPPVTNHHLSAYMDKYALDKHNLSLSNAKLKKLTGYKLRHPDFTKEAISDMVQKWKDENSWPKVD
jgi:hypothetical protein